MTAAFRAGTPLTAERADIALPLVSVRGLTKDFVGDRGLFGRAETPLRAVAKVSLDIARGEVLGVVGESGSGKSTLGRLLLNRPPGASRSTAMTYPPWCRGTCGDSAGTCR
jgi:ABC-type glutathione transport system ATPase component